MKFMFTLLCVVSLLACVLLASAQAPSSSPKPGPEIKKLEAFIGRWNSDGDAKESPYGPAAKFSGTDTFEWVPGGFFVNHHWKGMQGSVAYDGFEIISYDSTKKMYMTRFFDNFGNSGAFTGGPSGNMWT